MAIRAGIKQINFVSPTAHDAVEVNIMGPSGILRVPTRDPRPRWFRSRKLLEWPNGARLSFFSGEEPDQLRGPQCEICLIDELARMPAAEAVFDMASFGTRLGQKPRMLIATTPRPTPFIRKLVKMREVAISGSKTEDNAANLPPEFLRRLRDQYEGTRLGRQEMLGLLLLTDPSQQLFRDEWIHHDDVADEQFEYVSVAVDPSGGADEVGIVVGALLFDGRIAILADRTLTGTPGQWGDAAVRAHDEFNAQDVVVEKNFGGDMALATVQNAAERLHQRGERSEPHIRVREVSASRGKVARCEPISLLYEKGRIVHRRGLEKLEAELTTFSREWDREKDGSPNRLDAAVWVATRLSKIVIDLPIA
jgi:phage terminase large subunit-like protein